MPDLRIISYLPNPRLYKALIAARYSGAEIEVRGAKPMEMPNWLWDYDARPLAEDEKPGLAQFKRTAKTGFQGDLYKTDAFLAANPFGDIPAAFGVGGADGNVGLFESNAIMRAAARLGPKAPVLLGDGPLEQSRIDGFLDRLLLFAKDIQGHLLASDDNRTNRHEVMTQGFTSLMTGVEQALSQTEFLAGDAISLADVAFACELCLLSNEVLQKDKLAALGLAPVTQGFAAFPKAKAHLDKLLDLPAFNEDLASYKKNFVSL